jgi:hypothetical protein
MDGVDVAGEQLRLLTDAEVARRGEPEDVDGDARVPAVQLQRGGADEPRDRLRLRRVRPDRIPDRRHVAVGGKAHVVELNLAEAGVHGRHGDGEVVRPDPPVVGIEPAEPAARAPDAAVAIPQRQPRPTLRQNRILERDDSADQVEARRVHLPRRTPRVVVRLRRADAARERRGTVHEPDLAVLALHVELDRVQPRLPERDVLGQLAG